MLGTGCTFRKLYTEEDGSCKGEAFLRCINDEDLAKDLDALKKIAAKYEVEIVVRDSDNEYYKPTSLESDGYKYVRKIGRAYLTTLRQFRLFFLPERMREDLPDFPTR